MTENSVEEPETQSRRDKEKAEQDRADVMDAKEHLRVAQNAYCFMIHDLKNAIERRRKAKEAVETLDRIPSSPSSDQDDAQEAGKVTEKRDQAMAELAKATETHLVIRVAAPAIQRDCTAAERALEALKRRVGDDVASPMSPSESSSSSDSDEYDSDEDWGEEGQLCGAQQGNQQQPFRIQRPLVTFAQIRLRKAQKDWNMIDKKRRKALQRGESDEVCRNWLEAQKRATGRLRMATGSLQLVQAAAAKADVWDKEHNNFGANRVPNPMWVVDAAQNVNCTGMGEGSARNVNCSNLTRSFDNINCHMCTDIVGCAVSPSEGPGRWARPQTLGGAELLLINTTS